MDINSAISLRTQMLKNNDALQEAKQKKIALTKDTDKRNALEDKRLREVADDFESLFTKMLVDSMHKTLNKEDDMFYGGQAQEIFDDMLNEEYAKEMARTRALGISDMIVEYYGK